MKRTKIGSSALKSSLTKRAKRKLKREIFKQSQKAVDKATSLMLAEFDSHPVTKEIEGGPNTTNRSGTLGGTGNLFSFIGFNKGDRPTKAVRRILEASTRLKGLKENPDGSLGFEVIIEIPTKSEIKDSSPIPWAAARSWVIGIEQGLSGLGQFLVKPGAGRSGGGLEVSGSIRSGKFKNTKYVSQILANLQSNLIQFLRK